MRGGSKSLFHSNALPAAPSFPRCLLLRIMRSPLAQRRRHRPPPDQRLVPYAATRPHSLADAPATPNRLCLQS
jgi:hypothetical protein